MDTYFCRPARCQCLLLFIRYVKDVKIKGGQSGIFWRICVNTDCTFGHVFGFIWLLLTNSEKYMRPALAHGLTVCYGRCPSVIHCNIKDQIKASYLYCEKFGKLHHQSKLYSLTSIINPILPLTPCLAHGVKRVNG